MIIIFLFSEIKNTKFLIDFLFKISGNLTNVKQLIESGADINFADPHGWCPLMLAAWNGINKKNEI